MDALVSVTWFFFMAVFFYLAYAHWQQSRTEIRSFHLREGEGEERSEAREAVEGFVKDFNRYLEQVNAKTKNQNLTATVGYFFAGLAALISWIVVMTR